MAEYLKLNRSEKYDPDEGEILVTFKYYAGRPMTMYKNNGDPGDPAEPDEVSILKIESTGPMNVYDGAHIVTKAGVDITDLITEAEFEEIETHIYENWASDQGDDEADYRYELWREDRNND